MVGSVGACFTRSGSDSRVRGGRAPLSHVLPEILAAGNRSVGGEGEPAKVMLSSQEFLEQLARDSQVRDWLISVSKIPKVRSDYWHRMIATSPSGIAPT
jgi:hypothetical protein